MAVGVMAVVIVAAAATVMAMVTEAAWALALLSVFRSTGGAIIRTPPTLILPILIPDLITAIRGQRWHLLAGMQSRAILRPLRHRPRSKTGSTAPTRNPITPISGSVPVAGSVFPPNPLANELEQSIMSKLRRFSS